MFRIILLAVLTLGLAACDSPAGTVREIKQNLETFQKYPTIQTKERLDRSFDKINDQVRALEDRGDTVNADLFRRQALTLLYEYHSTRLAFSKWSAEQATLSTERKSPDSASGNLSSTSLKPNP
jgi:hypothetical protein